MATIDYASYVSSGTAFTDTEFTSSDGLYWSDYNEGTLDDYTSATWKRARTKLTTATMFGDGIKPYDID